METEGKEFSSFIKDIHDPSTTADLNIIKQATTYIDQERIDRTIDMIDKITTLAREKNFNIDQYLEKYGNIKTIPSKQDILNNPQKLVPLVEDELRKMFVSMTT